MVTRCAATAPAAKPAARVQAASGRRDGADRGVVVDSAVAAGVAVAAAGVAVAAGVAEVAAASAKGLVDGQHVLC